MLTLQVLPQTFSVCKVRSANDIDLMLPFCFVAKTDTELSYVCPAESIPPACTVREDGFRALRVRGALDFSLVGILSRLSGALAAQGISLFALSTFDTDYILVRSACLRQATATLRDAGYEIEALPCPLA